MQIIDPVTLGDVACTRASPKWVFDRTGTLVQVPANTLAVTYDPSDLSRAPYALVEAAATNLHLWSDQIDNAYWKKRGTCAVAPDAGIAPSGALTMDLLSGLGSAGTNDLYSVGISFGTAGTRFEPSFFVRKVSQAGILAVQNSANVTGGLWRVDLSKVGSGAERITREHPAVTVQTEFTVATPTADNGLQFYSLADPLSFYFGGVQAEVGVKATSPIPTTSAPAPRTADVIAPGAGVVYSNVPIVEPAYNASATYAKDALVYDPATYNVYQSLTAANTGKALTDTTAWTPRGVVNQRAMLDQYNNTQTTNPEEILLVVSPQAISRGLYLGNMDGAEVRISVVDQYKGLVYREEQSLRVSTSGSSFYNWCFNRIKRRTWALSLKLPPYANALVTILIRKPGGVAKCGMFGIGPVIDLGKTLMGLGAEIKDFSETSFNFDGTSTTKIRNYAKRITADVSVDSDQVDAVYEALADYRQRPIVWIGSKNYGLSIAYGRYSSFKPVIKGATRWEMALQIEGTV